MTRVWAVKETFPNGSSRFIPINGYVKIDGHFVLQNGQGVPIVQKTAPTPERAIFAAQGFQNGFLGQFAGHQYTAETMKLPPANPEFSAAHRLPSNAECVAAMNAESYPAQQYHDGPNIGMIFIAVVFVLAILVALSLFAPNIACTQICGGVSRQAAFLPPTPHAPITPSQPVYRSTDDGFQPLG